MHEYEFYKEFLFYLHQRDYLKAKLLVSQYEKLIPKSGKWQKAKRVIATRLGFYAFALFKGINQRKDIRSRT